MDSGRRGPPVKGGQASQIEGPSPSKKHGLPGGIIQKTSSSAGSLSSSNVRSRALVSQPRSAKDQTQIRAEAQGQGTQTTLTGDKRAASELESEDRPDKRRAITLPGKPTTASIPKSEPLRCIVWYDFGMPDLKPLFGSIDKISGVSIKVKLASRDTGRLSVVLSMGVNKGDLSKPVSRYLDRVSRFRLVWELDAKTPWGFQVQQFDHTSLNRNQKAVGEAADIIMKDLKGNQGQLKLVEMKVNGFQVETPCEQCYWRRLNAGSEAQRNINVAVSFLDAMTQVRCPLMRFKFWFRAPSLQWDQACSSVFNRYIDERQDKEASDQAPEHAPYSGEEGTIGNVVPKDQAGSEEFSAPSQALEGDLCSEDGEVGNEESSEADQESEEEEVGKRESANPDREPEEDCLGGYVGSSW